MYSGRDICILFYEPAVFLKVFQETIVSWPVSLLCYTEDETEVLQMVQDYVAA